MKYDKLVHIVNAGYGWQHRIYHMDEPNARLHVSVKEGRDAMTYLMYLNDHYNTLLATIAFIHATNTAGWPVACRCTEL